MPGRKAKPPRLLQRNDGSWVIKDRNRYIRIGCKGSSDDVLARAAEKLSDYIGRRHRPTVGERDPDRVSVADIVIVYADIKEPPQGTTDRERIRRHDELLTRLGNITEFFGDKMVGEIRAQLCRDYVSWRTGSVGLRADLPPPRSRKVSPSSARRELEDLRAAVNHYHAEHTLSVVPKITLPEKAPARDRWLTRTEAARLIGAALGFVWDPTGGRWQSDDAGRLVRRDRATRTRRRHIARFVLIGLYSGRREATIRRAQWVPSVSSPWLDLDHWIYHGRGRAERKTKKRRPPAAIAYRLRPHLSRWHRLDEDLGDRIGMPVTHVIHKHDGRPLADKIKTGWTGILADAALGPEVVRHVLRHTAATWLMQAGTDLWAAAGFLGMTVEQLEEGYGHQHPAFQNEAASAFGGRR